MTPEEKKNALLANLPQFTGTENWYRHSLNHEITYTDGVKYMAEIAGAYWLIDEIAIANKHVKAVVREDFQTWKLKAKGSKAKLTCGDGNGHVVYSKKIDFTDFPLDEIILYCTNNVILLTSEY